MMWPSPPLCVSPPEEGEYFLKVLIPSYAAGSIIGKGGQTIVQLQKETGATIKLSKSKDFYPGKNQRSSGTPTATYIPTRGVSMSCKCWRLVGKEKKSLKIDAILQERNVNFQLQSHNWGLSAKSEESHFESSGFEKFFFNVVLCAWLVKLHSRLHTLFCCLHHSHLFSLY